VPNLNFTAESYEKLINIMFWIDIYHRLGLYQSTCSIAYITGPVIRFTGAIRTLHPEITT